MATSDLIIGLGHKKRVGKNAFAGFLAKELEALGYEVLEVAFSHDMKDMAETAFGLYGLRGGCHYESKPEEREQPLGRINKTPRQLWIEFGNAMRGIYPEMWVDRLHDFMKEYREYTTRYHGNLPLAFIITDVRFPNEAAAVKRWGGTLIKIFRDSAPLGLDPAEVALDRFDAWDYAVNNNSDLDNLASWAVSAAYFLHNKPYWKGN